MLLWLDLETTGLDPDSDLVLEVAAIATDDAFREVARFHRVTSEARRVDLARVDRVVQEMHARSGLWGESLLASEQLGSVTSEDGAASSAAISCVDVDLAAFVARHCAAEGPIEPRGGGAKLGPQLAGSTISFDRAFLARHLRTTHSHLHYRNLDVSTLHEMARRFWKAAYDGRPKGAAAHRAMADAEESLRVARYYSEALGLACSEPEVGW